MLNALFLLVCGFWKVPGNKKDFCYLNASATGGGDTIPEKYDALLTFRRK